MKKCSIIMPISQTKRFSKTEWEDIYVNFSRIWKKLGYDCERIHLSVGGQIFDEIIENLYYSNIIFADLSDFNPNVIYELGIRQTLNKPTICVCHTTCKKEIPFDLSGQAIFFYENTKLGFKKLEKHIKNVIAKIETNPEIFQSAIKKVLFKTDLTTEEKKTLEQTNFIDQDIIYNITKLQKRIKNDLELNRIKKEILTSLKGFSLDKEIFAVDEIYQKHLINEFEKPENYSAYFVDILGADAWNSPRFLVYLISQLLYFAKSNYFDNEWHLKFEKNLNIAIKNAIKNLDNINLSNVFSNYEEGKNKKTNFSIARILAWNKDDMKSSIAENLIELHRIFNIPLFYIDPEKLPKFIMEQGIEFHLILSKNGIEKDSMVWYKNRRIKLKDYNKLSSGPDLDPKRFFVDKFKDKKIMFAAQKRSQLLRDEEHNNLLFINSPSLDQFGFRGAPTSLLYAIGPLIEAIKNKEIAINNFSEKNIFDPPFHPNYEEEYFQRLKLKLEEINPIIIGISSSSDSFHKAIHIARNIKNFNENIITILGGPHLDELNFEKDRSSNNPFNHKTENDKPLFDFAVKDDGEFILLELIKRILLLKDRVITHDTLEKIKSNLIKNRFPNKIGKCSLHFIFNNKIQNLRYKGELLDLNKLPNLHYNYIAERHITDDFDIFKHDDGSYKRTVRLCLKSILPRLFF